jgi:hypothetical protein
MYRIKTEGLNLIEEYENIEELNQRIEELHKLGYSPTVEFFE